MRYQEDLHVIVVENNADDMVFLKDHLSRIKERKVTIQSCLSLLEGLKLISRGWADIVFVDLSLADSWGIETVRNIRRHAPSLPIVALTGTDDEEIALQAMYAGAQDYLLKGELNPSLLGRSINYATERALRVSEHRLRLALESAKMGVWDWNLEGSTVSRSPLHDYIYGYEDILPDWSYEKFLTRVLPEDLLYVQRVVGKGVTEGNFKLECRIIHAGDGSVRWISIRGETSESDNGKPTRIIGTIKDITESKRLEQLALEAQEKREQTLRAIVQHAPIGIVILDSDLKVMDTNASFNSMIGQDLSQMINQPLTVLLPHNEVRAAVQRTKQGKPVLIARLELSFPHLPAGAKNYWDLALWPILRGGDIFSGAILQIIDCTQTVLLERQRDDFVASVAHDIKNPLIGAARILDMMCSSTTPTTKYATYIGVLRESNQNLLSLVQNLVDIYRYETIAYPCYLENVTAMELFDSCIQQLAHFAEQNDISLHHNVTSPEDSFIADAVGIRRVITNLLHNAIKFNKHGGKVEISLENLDGFSRICVTDTGDGMSQSDQELLFQRFSQGSAGKTLTGGTGLGLHLSKQIIDAHHGDIKCRSERGKGSTFVITLPREKRRLKIG